jgi:hypothetical protein
MARLIPLSCDLLFFEASRPHSDTQHSVEFPGQILSPTQRLLSENTQHSQQTDIHAPVGFETAVTVRERPQTYALDRGATGIGINLINSVNYFNIYIYSLCSLIGVNINNT